jgi:hypothetical protein
VETLGAIVAEMEAKHGAEHAGWIERALEQMDADEAGKARQKWQAIDARVAAALERRLDERFGIQSL